MNGVNPEKELIFLVTLQEFLSGDIPNIDSMSNSKNRSMNRMLGVGWTHGHEIFLVPKDFHWPLSINIGKDENKGWKKFKN
jgi:hypothetical protein